MTNLSLVRLGLVFLTTTSFTLIEKQSEVKIKVSYILKKDTLLKPDPIHPDYKKDSLKKWEKQFSDFSFHVYGKNNHVLPYRFHAPNNIEKGKKYPLVLFMHGAGERGFDNRLQFMRFTTTPFWEKYACYILAPQCPAKPVNGPDGEAVWVQTNFGATLHTMKPQPSWPLGLSMELLDKIIKENNVDLDRIYITGLSMGGFATWEILQREGNKFAAAMPVCGGADMAFAPKFSKIPIWVFHGDADNTVPVSRSRDIVKAIKTNGGNPIYTEFPGIGHGAWAVTYNDQKVWDWLFTQHK